MVLDQLMHFFNYRVPHFELDVQREVKRGLDCGVCFGSWGEATRRCIQGNTITDFDLVRIVLAVVRLAILNDRHNATEFVRRQL